MRTLDVRTYHRHTTNETVSDTDPAGCKNDFDGSNVVVGDLAVNSTESQGRGNHGDEHEERNSNGLLIKVGHLFNPVSSDSALELVDNGLTPEFTRIHHNLTGIRDEIFVGDSDVLLGVAGLVIILLLGSHLLFRLRCFVLDCKL